MDKVFLVLKTNIFILCDMLINIGINMILIIVVII
jgi:hypothetical protein